ncbi:hypothetical protein LH612_33525, partial [Klebsiella pneumoniae]|nr:hypothetical protein [Klebsiella pneumoniae]
MFELSGYLGLFLAAFGAATLLPMQSEAVLAGLLPIGEAAELTNIGILLAFVVVCAAIIVLRYRRPELPRNFKCPGMPVVPLIGIVFSLW